MNLRTHRSRLLPLAGLMLLSVAAWAQDQAPVFHWSGRLPAEKMVEIKNVNGDIDAAAAGDDEIQVTAEKSGRDAGRVRIEVVASSEGVTICAIYPPGIFGGSAGSCVPNKSYSSNVHGDDARVHFSVRLPRNLRFSGTTVNGGVTAEGLGRFVHAVSVNGPIRVSTSAWAQADTVNGSITAIMGDAAWTGTLKIASVNGSVELEMPDDLSADVKCSSVNGQMKSEFPLTVNNGFPVGHSARGTVGKGGRSLVIDTVNGNVDLRKSVGTI